MRSISSGTDTYFGRRIGSIQTIYISVFVSGSGSQQLTSGFSGANKAYLNSIDSLHYETHSEKSSRAGFKIIGSLQMPEVHLKPHCSAGGFVCLYRRQLFS
jgi:hypothetical protein